MRRLLLSLTVSLGVFSTALAGPLESPAPMPAPEPFNPLQHWEVDLEAGGLWRFGSNATDLNYVFTPVMLTLKTPAVFEFPLGNGSIGLRNRFSLLAEPIVEGPESYFFGVTAAGSLEWWNNPGNFSVFLAAGGGVGWLDSKGYEVEGAQGQDFNYTWFVHSGVRVMPWERVSISLGLYYQHVSNRGEDEINPGIDSLGPMVGVGWHF